MNSRKQTMPRQPRKTLLAARLIDWLVDPLRTSVAVVLSLETARVLRLPEAYWAPITTMVVMQSTLGAAWAVSTKRFIGTALGAVIGAAIGLHLGNGVLALGVGTFGLGLFCRLLRLDQSAYRFAGITFAIVVLVTRAVAPSTVALHRFIEVATGIVVALIVTALWPEGPEPWRGSGQWSAPASDRPLR